MSVTICHKLLETAKKQSDRVAVMYRTRGPWNEITWSEYLEIISTVAAGLQVMGVRKGDRVAILSNTRFEWAVADLAILGLGAVTVPIYPSSAPDDVEFILGNSEPRVLICENAAVAARLKTVWKKTKSIESVICFDSGENASEDFVSFDALQTRGTLALKKSPALFELAVSELSIDDTATIVYTSGTTGRPRGVVHSHVQIMSEIGDAFPLLGVTSRDRSLTFLPFAHVLGRIEIWGHAFIGYTMAFARSIERMRDDMADVQPTVMVAVPRVFEKIYNAVLAQAEISSVKKRVFNWALAVGREISRHKVEKLAVPIDLALKYQVARRLVFDDLKKRLGGRLRFAVSGGAPLSPQIAEFFHAAGLLVLEGYGLTETLACITVNTPFDYRFGSIGKAIGDVKLKLGEDGELLVQSKKVMKGYYKEPEATAAALEDGWLHTGDIAEISPEGYVRITDRKKDLIKTAGGKYVAPQRLEGLLKASPIISQVHIHGDQKKYVVALVTLNMDSVNQYAREIGIADSSPEALAENPKVKELVRRAVAEANSHLASFESIKNFAIIPKEFTVEGGELTPSLKIKRKVVDERYHDVLERLHA